MDYLYYLFVPGCLYFLSRDKEKRNTKSLLILLLSCLIAFTATISMLVHSEMYDVLLIMSRMATVSFLCVGFLCEFSRLGKERDIRRIDRKYKLMKEEPERWRPEEQERIINEWYKELRALERYY